MSWVGSDFPMRDRTFPEPFDLSFLVFIKVLGRMIPKVPASSFFLCSSIYVVLHNSEETKSKGRNVDIVEFPTFLVRQFQISGFFQ